MAIKVEIFGTDGEYLCVHGPGAGAQGVRMLGDPQEIFDSPVSVEYTSTASEVGGRPGPARRPVRRMQITFAALDQTPTGWAVADAKIAGAFDYSPDPWDPDAVPARIQITGPGSDPRSIDVLLAENLLVDMKLDPSGRKVSVVTAKLVAAQPDYYEPDWIGDEEHPAGWETTTDDEGTVWVRNPTNRPFRPTIIVTGTGTASFFDGSWRGPIGARVPGVDFRTGRDDSVRMNTLPHIDAVTNGGGARVNGDRRRVPLEDFAGTNLVGLWQQGRILYEIPPYTDWTEIPVAATDVSGTFGILFRQPRCWSRPFGLERLP